MKNRLAAFILGASLLALSMNSVSFANGTDDYFKDVTEGSPYYVAINYFTGDGVIEKAEYFHPDEQITRAEAIYWIMHIVLGYKPETALTVKPFNDVSKDTSDAPYIAKAKEMKIVNGYGSNKFQPQKKIVLSEALKMILETEKLIDTTIVFEKQKGDVFKDVKSTAWFASYAKIAKDKRIIKFGRSDEMLPNEIVTKGYLMEILYRLRRSHQDYKFGIASFYSDNLDGSGTSSGEKYSHKLFTAAHRTLPLGTRVRVTNLENNKSVEVRINDRGPYTKNFTLDLSQIAFESLAAKSQGIIPIQYIIIRSLP